MKKEEFLALMSAAAHDLAEFVIAQHPELFEETPKYPPKGDSRSPQQPATVTNPQSTEATAAADEEPPQAAPRQRRARFPFAGW